MRAPDVPARPVYLIGVRYSIFSRALNEVNTTRTMSLGGLFPYKCAKIPQIINNENENFAVKTIENFKKYHEKRGIFHQMFSLFKSFNQVSRFYFGKVSHDVAKYTPLMAFFLSSLSPFSLFYLSAWVTFLPKGIVLGL